MKFRPVALELDFIDFPAIEAEIDGLLKLPELRRDGMLI
jgi:hypothetical protein